MLPRKECPPHFRFALAMRVARLAYAGGRTYALSMSIDRRNQEEIHGEDSTSGPDVPFARNMGRLEEYPG
jgi:hypothetical protein